MTQPSAETSQDAKLDLAADLLCAGGTVHLRALGASMLPTLWPGDLLTIEAAPAAGLFPGAIVLTHRAGRFFIHRLTQRGSRSGSADWVTRGDSLPQCDPPVASCDVIGRVSGITRGRRTLVPRCKLSLAVRIFAWVLQHSDCVRDLALRCHSACQKLSVAGSGGSPRHDFPHFSTVANLPKE